MTSPDSKSVPEATSPLSRPGRDPTCDGPSEHIYMLCYGRPTLISDRDWAPHDRLGDRDSYPISHYVGWTRRHPRSTRVRQHSAKSGHFSATIVSGDKQDEALVKASGECPQCAGSLDYYAESPSRLPDAHG